MLSIVLDIMTSLPATIATSPALTTCAGMCAVAGCIFVLYELFDV